MDNLLGLSNFNVNEVRLGDVIEFNSTILIDTAEFIVDGLTSTAIELELEQELVETLH